MSLSVRPLQAPLGAVVEGVDVGGPLDPADRDALTAAADEHLLLLLPGAARHAGHADVVRFCSSFGALRPTIADRSRLPGHPAVNLVSNRTVDGVEGTGGHGEVEWHSDLHFAPPLIEWIYLDAVELTTEGGRTSWTNLCAAYDALPADTRERIEDLVVRCWFRGEIDFDGYFKASDRLSDRGESGTVSLVQRNPRTGRRSIWPTPGPALYHVEAVGMDPAESAELLGALYRHAVDERFVHTLQWEPGDAVLWRNTQTLHRREPFPAQQRRVLRHVNILGAADPAQQPAGG